MDEEEFKMEFAFCDVADDPIIIQSSEDILDYGDDEGEDIDDLSDNKEWNTQEELMSFYTVDQDSEEPEVLEEVTLVDEDMFTEPQEAAYSCIEPQEAAYSCTEPQEAAYSCTEPQEAAYSCTEHQELDQFESATYDESVFAEDGQGHIMMIQKLCVFVPKAEYIRHQESTSEEGILDMDLFFNRLDSALQSNGPARIILNEPAIIKLDKVKFKGSDKELECVYVVLPETMPPEDQGKSITKQRLLQVLQNSEVTDNDDLEEFIEMLSENVRTELVIELKSRLLRYKTLKGCLSIENEVKTRKQLIRDYEQAILTLQLEQRRLRQKQLKLRQKLRDVKDESVVKNDADIVGDVLSKYLDQDAVTFFKYQMRCSPKSGSNFHKSNEGKLLAYEMYKKNPAEYSILSKAFILPTPTLLRKFVNSVKDAELESHILEIEDHQSTT